MQKSQFQRFDIGRALSEGWEIFQPNLGIFVGATAIFLVAQLLFNSVPIIGGLVLLLINGPLWGGFYLLTLDAKGGSTLDLKRMLDGFSRFGPLALSHICSTIFTILPLLGALLFTLVLLGPTFIENIQSAEPIPPDPQMLIPIGAALVVGSLLSILVASWYIFIYVIAVAQNLEFWDVMEESRAIAFNQPFMTIGLMIVFTAINIVGLVAFFIGLMFTFPFSLCVVSAAYQQTRPYVQDKKRDAFTGGSDISMPPPL